MTKINVVLEVLVDDNGNYSIDGYSDGYDFESGIEYTLNCAEPIWLTWTNIENNYDKIFNSVSGISLYELENLTTHNHHKYTTDRLIYQIMKTPIYSFEGFPIGLIAKQKKKETIADWDLNAPLSDTVTNRRILEYGVFDTNSTLEDVLTIYQDQEDVGTLTNPYRFSDQEQDVNWNDYGKYLGVIQNGVRIDYNDYQLVWRNNEDYERILFKDNLSGDIRIKTDLFHLADNNGSTSVTFMIRPGDERFFYLNNHDRSNNDFSCRGINAPENVIYIQQKFDDYIIEKYPRIYELLKTYVLQQSMRSEPMSYLRNMIEFIDVDTTNEAILNRMLREIFSPFESSLTNKKHLLKNITDFFANKGNLLSLKWLANVMFKKDLDLKVFNDDLIYLSSSRWKQRYQFYLTQTDIDNLVTEGLISDFSDLEGYEIFGEKSKANGIIQTIELQEINTVNLYKVLITLYPGPKFEDEKILIRNISGKDLVANSSSINEDEISIVGANIINPGFGYKPGNKVYSTTTTGMEFSARVSSVDSKGSIKTIEIVSPGWWFREYQFRELLVENQTIPASQNYDVTLDFVPIKKQLADNILKYEGRYEYNTLSTSTTYLIDQQATITRQNGYNDSFTVFSYKNVKYYVSFSGNTLYLINRNDTTITITDFIPTGEIIRAITYENDRFVIVTDTEIKSFTRVQLVNLIVFETPIVFSVITLDASHSGHFTGCALIKDRILVFQDSRMFSYLDGMFEGSTLTPTDFTTAYAQSNLGIVTIQFFGKNGNYAQQYLASNKHIAEIESVFGRVSKIPGYYEDSKSTLSGSSKILGTKQNHSFSLGYTLNETTDKYMSVFKETVNTAGYDTRGIYRIKSGTLTIQENLNIT